MIVCGIGFLGFSGAYFWPSTSNQAAHPTATPTPGTDNAIISGDQLTIHDLFLNDLSGRSYNFVQNMSTDLFIDKKNIGPVQFEIGLYGDFISRSQFIGLYLPALINYQEFLTWFSSGYKDYLHNAKINIHIWAASPSGESQPISDDLAFTKQLYIYHENIMTDEQRFQLETTFRRVGIQPTFRGFSYLQYRRVNGPGVPKPKPQINMAASSDMIPAVFAPDPSNAIEPSIITLFMTDFKGDGRGLKSTSYSDITLSVGAKNTLLTCKIFYIVYYDKTNNARHIAVYIPVFQFPQQVIQYASSKIKQWMDDSDKFLIGKDKEASWISNTIFDEIVYVYVDDSLSPENKSQIAASFSDAKLAYELRSSEYWVGRTIDVRNKVIPMPPKYEIIDGLPQISVSPTNPLAAAPPSPTPPTSPAGK
jgi:hypothetical protein